MQDRMQSLDPAIAALIQRTVRELMTPFGLRNVVSRLGEDHDGDPVIRIEAQYDLNDVPIDPDIMARLALLMRERLWEQSESRFPHIRHRFDDRHPVMELTPKPPMRTLRPEPARRRLPAPPFLRPSQHYFPAVIEVIHFPRCKAEITR